jgi:hypothetical protein
VGEQVMVCLQPRLKVWLNERAAQEEMGVSTFIRALIAREAKRDLQRSTEVQSDDLRVAFDE